MSFTELSRAQQIIDMRIQHRRTRAQSFSAHTVLKQTRRKLYGRALHFKDHPTLENAPLRIVVFRIFDRSVFQLEAGGSCHEGVLQQCVTARQKSLLNKPIKKTTFISVHFPE